MAQGFQPCGDVQNVKGFRKQHLKMHVHRKVPWWVLFKIGVVWENVNKVLDHSVAEVILLLEGKAKGEAWARKRLETIPNNTNVEQDDDFFFLLLPWFEPCVVSAYVNFLQSEKHPGGLQLLLFPECCWEQ